jgi:ribokinase
MKIVIVGSSNTDMIIKVPRIPNPGETILGGKFSTSAGGKGANQAVAAARAGGKVTFIGRVGRDMFGDRAIQGFQKDGIDVQYVFRDDSAPSGVAEIFVDEKGENSIAVASGANANLDQPDIQVAEPAIADAQFLLMQLEVPLETVLYAAKTAYQNGVPVILNPAPAQPLPDELLNFCNVLTPNESEIEILTGIKVNDDQSAFKAAEYLYKKGVDTVIITLGSRGAYIHSAGLDTRIPGFKVKSVDTTAAGDVFNGALAVALAENQRLQDAVVFANAAAALSVGRLGAQPSAPSRQEIDEFLATQ